MEVTIIQPYIHVYIGILGLMYWCIGNKQANIKWSFILLFSHVCVVWRERERERERERKRERGERER